MATSRFTEFGSDFDIDFPSIPSGWKDTSWHNDACPSYEVKGKNLIVYIDHADPDQRECGGKRFAVVSTDDEGSIDASLIETDDFAEVIALVNSL